MRKLGRNEPCRCGSGKKFKKCHWPKTQDNIYARYGSFGTPLLENTIRSGPPKKDPEILIKKIKYEKQVNKRSLPSSGLISIGDNPLKNLRVFLVDTCARIVDQHWCGRSEMCIYFAVLIRHGLEILGYRATVEVGKAQYIMAGQNFEWDHAWVLTEAGDIVDGNVDSMVENPCVPNGIEPKPYWGPYDVRPPDRHFVKLRELHPPQDEIELDAKCVSTWKAELEKEIKSFPHGCQGPRENQE